MVRDRPDADHRRLSAGSFWRPASSWLGGSVGRQHGAGEARAAIALALMAANYGVRAAAHQQALARRRGSTVPTLPAPCDPAAFGSLLDSWPPPGEPRDPARTLPRRHGRHPDFLSPFEWRVIAQLPRRRTDHVSTIDRSGAPRSPVADPEPVDAGGRTSSGHARPRRSCWGSRGFPSRGVLVEPSGATTVQFTDLRFTGLEDPTSGAPIGAVHGDRHVRSAQRDPRGATGQ